MFIIKLALKHLLSSKRQSLLVVTAVALGVLVIIFIPSVNSGFYDELLNKTINTSPHITITRYNTFDDIESLIVKNNKWELLKDKKILKKRRIQAYKSVIDSLKGIKGVVGYSPFVNDNGTLINGEQNINVQFNGIMYPSEQNVVDIDKDLVVGSYQKLNPDGIAISQRIATDLKIAMGDNIKITTQKASKLFKVVAMYNSGFYTKDVSTVYISMNSAQQLIGIGNQVDGVGVKVADPWQAANISHNIVFKTGLQARSWEADNQSLLSEIAQFNNVSLFINVTIMLAVAAGVLGIMVIMINSRQKQIGMLKALGVTSVNVIKIFVLEGAVLSLFGGIAGSLLATGLIAYFNANPFTISENYGVTEMQASYSWTIYAQAIFLSMMSGVFAAFIPAYFASQIDPAEVLKST